MSLQAEQSVIGGLLLNNSKWTEVSNILKVSDFSDQQHQSIYTAIGHLLHEGKPADVLTLSDSEGFDLAYLGKKHT